MSSPAEPFDIAIIGGGVNGAGIARDAAGRDARVLLLERGDLAAGSSSASTKLIHGGLRYLEHYEFALVREALAERERLWAIAPHIIRPARFVLPYVKGLRPRWLLRAGLFLYDHIGGRKRLPATTSIDLRRHPAGAALRPEFVYGFEYSDCRVDDSRLVVLNARDAADRGAEIATRTELLGAARVEGVWKLTSRGPDGERIDWARALVNAAGPSALDVVARTGERSHDRIRLVRGSHIVVPKLFNHDYCYFFQLPDGRIFFALPYERDFTMIGTTDVDHEGSPFDVAASEEEVAYLCEGVNRYFARPTTPADVIWAWAGVRPLIDDGSGRPEAATRGYRLDLEGEAGEALLLNIFGGKITSYRHLSEQAVDRLLGGEGWTATVPLPGGDFATDGFDALVGGLAADYPFLDRQTVERIAHAYGTCAGMWLGAAKSLTDLGEHFGAGLTAAEVDYLVEREWARTADDILLRRSKLGLKMADAGREALERYLQN